MSRRAESLSSVRVSGENAQSRLL